MLSATAVVIVATGQSPAAIILLSLTVLSASLVALGTYRALSPLATRDAIEAPQMLGGRTRAALEREKTLVLRSIKDLEFDFAMKKMSQSDYDEMSARLRARAVGLMRQLDEGSGYRALIEAEFGKRLGRRGLPPAGSSTPATVEPETPRRRGGHNGVRRLRSDQRPRRAILQALRREDDGMITRRSGLGRIALALALVTVVGRLDAQQMPDPVADGGAAAAGCRTRPGHGVGARVPRTHRQQRRQSGGDAHVAGRRR